VTKITRANGSNVVSTPFVHFPFRTNIGILAQRVGSRRCFGHRRHRATRSGRVRRSGTSRADRFRGGFNGSLNGEKLPLRRAHYGATYEVVGFTMDFAELGEYSTCRQTILRHEGALHSVSAWHRVRRYLSTRLRRRGRAIQRKCRRRSKSAQPFASSSCPSARHHRDYAQRWCRLKDGRLLCFDSVDEASRVYEAA